MAQLTWNNVGERFFETGLDRGVLYPQNGDGVVWNGLTSVSESSSGGTITPYYQDGVKMVEIPSLEEFTGKIEAFTFPDEFAECDGTVLIGGLSAYQQRRKRFGLSYRTRLGNDLDGKDHAYRLHLIYNAMAAPSDREYETLDDDIDPMSFSWDFTTIPMYVVSNRRLAPMAHISIDSRKTSAGIMRTIEQNLYGTSTKEPRLMTLEEIFSLFDEPYLAQMQIEPNEVTGISPLYEVAEGGDLDSDGKTTGIYTAVANTRLVTTSEPGIFTLED